MEQEYIKEEQYIKAKKRVKEVKDFYGHLSVYLIVNTCISIVVILGFIYEEKRTLNQAIKHLGVYMTWLGWGIGLAFHWMEVFGKNKLGFGKDWEERKIKELMSKDNNLN
ncbi:2TM domain-containing protein [Tenacibaculum sp. 190524A02b]|uniref:2TM domain-containing protein n=1 Tax=Tenacibaculum vairaonense TaxID=3137860 RepID=A0ABP1FGE8_9FLAO